MRRALEQQQKELGEKRKQFDEDKRLFDEEHQKYMEELEASMRYVWMCVCVCTDYSLSFSGLLRTPRRGRSEVTVVILVGVYHYALVYNYYASHSVHKI